jgi:hypothetical protein
MSILEQIGPKVYNNEFNSTDFNFKIDINRLQDSIIERYSKFNPYNKINRIFVDKSLENFFNLEMILKIFPNAKFLHTFRSPIDSIISIYQSMLPELSGTHSIRNILIYLDNYQKVLSYFKKKYPEAIMNVGLENFTENSNQVAKEIYQFCNLTWNENVLNYYKRDDLFSKTLSFTQIRQKVLKYNENKYRPYFYLLSDYKEKYTWLNT